MFKSFFLLALCFNFPLLCLGQNDSNVIYSSVVNLEEFKTKNQIDLDVEIFAATFGYKFKVYENWFVGPSFGLGVANRVGQGGFFQELIHIGISTKYHLNNFIHFEIEPRASVVIEYFWEGDVGVTYGIVSGVYLGDAIQLGVNLNLGFHKDNHNTNYLVSSSLLALRIPLRK